MTETRERSSLREIVALLRRYQPHHGAQASTWTGQALKGLSHITANATGNSLLHSVVGRIMITYHLLDMNPSTHEFEQRPQSAPFARLTIMHHFPSQSRSGTIYVKSYSFIPIVIK